MVQLICTDRGQHPPRDIVEMIRLWRVPENCTPRWYVHWRDVWVYPRRKQTQTPWHPVWPLDSVPGDLHLDRRLREADVLEFHCPTCSRRPRWRRDRLDELCERASAESVTALDLSRLE